MTEEQFTNAIRLKYPDAYQDLDYDTLRTAFLKKYPAYREQIDGYSPADPSMEPLKEPSLEDYEFTPEDYDYEAQAESTSTMVDELLTPKSQHLDPELFKKNKIF